MPNTIKVTETSNYVRRPFLTLLCDAIRLAYLADQAAADHHGAAALARGSLLNTMFALEFAADSFMKAAISSSRLSENLDRIPILSKFEVALQFVRPAATLDRGTIQIQRLQELVRLRNRQVHAKSESSLMQLTSNPSDARNFELLKGSLSTTALNIPDESREWRHAHAVSGLQVLDEGLDLIFVKLAGLGPLKVQGFLADCIRSEGKTAILGLAESEAQYVARGKAEMGLTFSYLGF